MFEIRVVGWLSDVMVMVMVMRAQGKFHEGYI